MVMYGTCYKRGQHYVPQYLCSPVPMFPEPMFPGTYVPRYLCSPVPMFPEPNDVEVIITNMNKHT